MAYRSLCFTSAVLFLFSISSGETSSVNMCENVTTPIDEDNLELDAIGPPRSQLTTNTSTICSCLINTTSSSNKVSVQFSRITQSGSDCWENKYDEATLDLKSDTPTTLTLQDDDLSHYYEEYNDISAINVSITIHSICGSNYIIKLKEINWQIIWPVKFSYVTCSNRQIVVTTSTTTASPTTLRYKTTVASHNETSPTYSPKANISAGSAVKKNTSAPSQIGLIVGVVVGVGGGLLLLGAIILAVIIFRRRRAKRQPLTNANQNAPNETPYEPSVAYASVSYEDLRNSTQLQTEILYENQNAATDPLATETNQNYYSVQGYDNSTFHQSDAMPNNDQPSSEEVDHFAQEPHLINDTDTTVVENDLYEK